MCLRVTKGDGWGDWMRLWRHFTQICSCFPPVCSSGTPQDRSDILIFTSPSPLDCLQLPQQPIAGPSNTDLHKPQRPWSCLGVQPAILLNYFWNGEKKRMDSISKVCINCGFTQWNLYYLAVLLASACREFVPHHGSHSSQNTFLGVIQRGTMCHKLQSWCEVLQELRHLCSYPV